VAYFGIAIVQSLVRRRAARIVAEHKRHELLMDHSATVVQTAWRRFFVHSAYRSYQSATKILMKNGISPLPTPSTPAASIGRSYKKYQGVRARRRSQTIKPGPAAARGKRKQRKKVVMYCL
jgi:hypothetical protein